MKYIIVLRENQSSELVHVKIAYREETTLSCHPAINTRGVWSLIKDMQREITRTAFGWYSKRPETNARRVTDVTDD